MSRRGVIGALGALFVVVAATTIIRCPPIVVAFTPFSYASHERPRVFVSHHPLRAQPGQTVTVRLAPDPRTQNDPVSRAVAELGQVGGTPDLKVCNPQTDGTFTCAFTLAAGDHDFVYSGHLELQSGTRVSAATSYMFRAAATIGAGERLRLREPVKKVSGLQDSFRLDTVWVRDDHVPAGQSYDEAAFLDDVTTAVYDGILADPVYRWRDAQLAFFQFGGTGFTSSYYSGFDTRCGQNPFPQDRTFPAALRSAAVVGVLHRHPTTSSGDEGTVDPTANLSTVFRDCAGESVRAPGVASFSTTGGRANTGRVAKHEFGHAAFGLGDEYTEPQSTRNVSAANVNPQPDPACCCLVPQTGGVTGGGTSGGATTGGGTVGTPVGGTGGGGIGGAPRTMQCVAPGGGVTTGPAPLLTGLSECPVAFAPQCGASPQAGCPSLSGPCVETRNWAGQQPPTGSDTARPNTFASHAACDAGRARALVHPGVEDRAQALGTCRELCGPTTTPCPCGQAEAWIVDTNPAVPAPTNADVDTMGSIAAARDGGTCEWCVETTLCVRWHRALGDDPAKAWGFCDAPPEDAVAREQGFRALVQWLSDFIRTLTQRIPT